MKKLIADWFGDGQAEGTTYFLVFTAVAVLLYGSLLWQVAVRAF